MADGKSLTDFMDSAFWTRPEGKIAKLVLGALGIGAAVGVGVGVLFYLPAILAFIATVLSSMLTIAVTGIALFAIIALILNEDFRNTAGFIFRAGIRWFSDFIIDLTPIAVLRDFIAELKTNLQMIDEQLKNLAKQIADLKRLITTNENEKERSLALMSEAQRQGKDRARVLQGRNAGRLQRSNMTLQQLFGKMEMVSKVLQKMRENCDFSIQDTESEVNITIREYTALQAGQEATRAAMKIIKGDPKKKAMFDQAMEVLATRTAGAVGEMSELMRVSQNFFDSVDLQNGVFDDQALKMLEQWEKKADSAILGPGEKQGILNSTFSEAVPYDKTAVRAADENQLTQSSVNMDDYFKN